MSVFPLPSKARVIVETICLAVALIFNQTFIVSYQSSTQKCSKKSARSQNTKSPTLKGCFKVVNWVKKVIEKMKKGVNDKTHSAHRSNCFSQLAYFLYAENLTGTCRQQWKITDLRKIWKFSLEENSVWIFLFLSFKYSQSAISEF